MAGTSDRNNELTLACRHFPGILSDVQSQIMSLRSVVLGSRSPRRRELLGSMTGIESMTFDSQIRQRLVEIAALKHADVQNQLPHQPWFSPDNPPVIVVADTTVVTGESDGTREVLGQPEPEHWRQQVREWFALRLSGRTHEVWTAVIVSRGNTVRSVVVRSRVTFSAISDTTMDWYLSTNESPGKAGGYAIQGFAASFVTHMEGSLTNVIGLPLLETMELIRSLPD